MKTGTMNVVLGGFVCGALAWGTVNLRAQGGGPPPVPAGLTFALFGTVQNPGAPNSKGNLTMTTRAVKLTAADLLRLAASAHGVTYPGTAYLALLESTVVVMQRGGTSQLDDLTGLFTVTYGQGAFNGLLHLASGSSYGSYYIGWGSATGSELVTISFDDFQGTSFSVTGLANVTTTVGGSANSGFRTDTYSATMAVAGYGTVSDSRNPLVSDDAVWTGTIRASGTGLVPTPALPGGGGSGGGVIITVPVP